MAGKGQRRIVRALVVLDWRDPRHWSSRKRACRVCRNLTNLRDGQGRPCDKTCAEQELAAEMTGASAVYFADERAPSFADERVSSPVKASADTEQGTRWKAGT